MNQLFLLQYVKMEGLSSGIIFVIQGSREEEHVGPNLHSQRSKQDQNGCKDNGSFLQGRPSSGDR